MWWKATEQESFLKLEIVQKSTKKTQLPGEGYKPKRVIFIVPNHDLPLETANVIETF